MISQYLADLMRSDFFYLLIFFEEMEKKKDVKDLLDVALQLSSSIKDQRENLTPENLWRLEEIYSGLVKKTIEMGNPIKSRLNF